MPTYRHVTSSRNRASITENGLDWTRMGPAPGIAGSSAPEVEGCFLCVDFGEDEWFVRLNNTGGPVDVWEVAGVSREELLISPQGHAYIARAVAPGHLKLLRQDLPPQDRLV